MRTRCSQVQSSPPGLYLPSYGILTSRGRMSCPSRRPWRYRFRGVATICPNAFIYSSHRCFKPSVNFISFLQMATYMKSLARRASLAEGSIKVVKVSKAKIASLTSENADLRARMQRLAEDTVKYESDLKHTTPRNHGLKIKKRMLEVS